MVNQISYLKTDFPHLQSYSPRDDIAQLVEHFAKQGPFVIDTMPLPIKQLTLSFLQPDDLRLCFCVSKEWRHNALGAIKQMVMKNKPLAIKISYALGEKLGTYLFDLLNEIQTIDDADDVSHVLYVPLDTSTGEIKIPEIILRVVESLILKQWVDHLSDQEVIKWVKLLHTVLLKDQIIVPAFDLRMAKIIADYDRKGFVYYALQWGNSNKRDSNRYAHWPYTCLALINKMSALVGEISFADCYAIFQTVIMIYSIDGQILTPIILTLLGRYQNNCQSFEGIVSLCCEFEVMTDEIKQRVALQLAITLHRCSEHSLVQFYLFFRSDLSSTPEGIFGDIVNRLCSKIDLLSADEFYQLLYYKSIDGASDSHIAHCRRLLHSMKVQFAIRDLRTVALHFALALYPVGLLDPPSMERLAHLILLDQPYWGENEGDDHLLFLYLCSLENYYPTQLIIATLKEYASDYETWEFDKKKLLLDYLKKAHIKIKRSHQPK